MTFPTLPRFLIPALALALPSDGLAGGSPAPAAPPRWLLLNEDNSHFFGTRPAEQMNVAGLEAWVDQYAGTAVTHLVLNPNAMRTNFRSRTRDAIWEPVDGVEPDGLWPRNAKRLHEAGIDPYAVWIRHARKRGLSPWISMRMNDVHSVDAPQSFMHSAFWRKHPQFRRQPEGPVQPWTNLALNYAHPEVRAYNFALLEELFERYDADGFELDWMRFPFHLSPGREREEGVLLDQFIRDTHRLAQSWAARRGHPIRLGVRVPAHPDAAAGLGLNAIRWAREGWLDLIVPCPFWRTADFDIPIELWKSQLGPAANRVVLAPGFEHNLRAWVTGTTLPNDLETLHGFAAAAHFRGADSFYLFNWMDSQTRPVSAEVYQQLLRDGLRPALQGKTPRRHPVTFRDTVPDGFPDGTQLPADARRGAKFQIATGARPDEAKIFAIAGFAPRPGIAAATFAAELNGVPLEEVAGFTDLARIGTPARALQWRCPPAAWRDGFNSLVIRQTGPGEAQQVVWAEIRLDPR